MEKSLILRLALWLLFVIGVITNLQPPPHYWTNDKINYYREEAQLILDTLGCANEYLAPRLSDKIKSYVRYS